jgi:hypothetical protein
MRIENDELLKLRAISFELLAKNLQKKNNFLLFQVSNSLIRNSPIYTS